MTGRRLAHNHPSVLKGTFGKSEIKLDVAIFLIQICMTRKAACSPE